MLDEKPIQRREVKARHTAWAAALARALAKAGFRPNTISALSVGFAAIGGACLVRSAGAGPTGQAGFLVAAAMAIQLRLLCNLFDGMVAVEGGRKTKSGEIFNDLPDRLADPIFLVCAGCAARAVPFGQTLGWLAALLAILTAYARTLGAAAGARQYFLGPMAKQHRMALLTAAFLAAAATARWGLSARVLTVALGLVAAGCAVTVWRRVAAIVRELESA